ncbi:MAG: cellulase family glycosylhydrolase [Phycisphaerae bacterium]|nr:cellulase family glycosylhydrolase [Phycisphaerae bacterium]
MTRRLTTLLVGLIALPATTGCSLEGFGKALGEGLFGESRASVHPALAARPSREGLGVNIHFYEGNEQDWKMLTEAGVSIVRMDVSWAGCEKKPGLYDFSHYDALIAKLEQHKIRLLFIIDYGNPLYDDGLAPHSDEGRAAYARFVSALVKRYAGKDIIWELWNEPNISFWKPKPNVNDYMAWCKAVVPAIRQADPNACVIGPATSRIPLDFIEQCFQKGLLDLVDGVSVHPYRNGKMGPETAIPEYKNLARLIEQYAPKVQVDGKQKRKTIPIISGEWGYTSTNVSRQQQGKYLPRQWLANALSKIPISIWYDWHDDGKDPKEGEHNFGTVTWDYKPKPAYLAMKTLLGRVPTVLSRIDVGSEQDFVLYTGELVIWTTGDPHEIDLGPGIKIAGAVDHLGNKIDVPDGPRQWVTDAPRYLAIAPPAPGWLTVFVNPIPLHRTVWGDYAMLVITYNAGQRTARVTLDPVRTDDVYVAGRWVGSFGDPNKPLEPQEPSLAMWGGSACRHDGSAVALKITARIACEGEPPHAITRTVEAGIHNPVSLDLAWRQDGLQVSVGTNGALPLTANLIPNVDGVDRQAVGVALAKGQKTAVVRWHDLRLAGVARHVGVRLVSPTGRVIAETEPMTYELVDPVIDPVDAPVGATLTDDYRLWHEGDKDRKVELKGQVVESPGGDPPFDRALRVDYEMSAGWCYWQIGPKQPSSIGMPGARPKRIMMWVRGDKSGDAIRLRVVDKTGQTFQPTGGKMDADGWRCVSLDLRHMGHWGGAGDGVVHWPLTWTSYFLQDSTRTAHSGATCVTGVVVAW